MVNHTKWTPEMIRDIEILTNQNLTSSVVAEKMTGKYGFTINKNQIIGAANRNNIKLYRPENVNQHKVIWTEDRVKQLKELWANNMPVNKIRFQLGISADAISKKAQVLGLPDRSASIVRQGGGLANKLRNKKTRKEPTLLFVSPTFVAKKSHEYKSFIELKNRDCRFIVNDGKPEKYLFCGKKSKDGSSYCETCHRIVYHKPTHNKERLKA